MYVNILSTQFPKRDGLLLWQISVSFSYVNTSQEREGLGNKAGGKKKKKKRPIRFQVGHQVKLV